MNRTYTYIPIEPDKLKELLGSIIEAELLKHNLIKLPEPPKEEFMDVATTARMLTRERSRVYAYVRAGILTAYKVKGIRGLKFKKHEVEAAIQQLNFGASITKKSLVKP